TAPARQVLQLQSGPRARGSSSRRNGYKALACPAPLLDHPRGRTHKITYGAGCPVWVSHLAASCIRHVFPLLIAFIMRTLVKLVRQFSFGARSLSEAAALCCTQQTTERGADTVPPKGG